MKKLLYINACIRTESRTQRLASNYLRQAFPAGQYQVQEVRVTDLDIAPMTEKDLYARDADIEAGNLNTPAYELAKAFASADQIVIAAPFWDCSFPACLKVYIEHICVKSITFDYTSDGLPAKLCRAGQLVYITTSGGFLRQGSSVKLYWEELCSMFAIEDMRFYCAAGLDIDPSHAEDILQRTLSHMLADRTAQPFRAIPARDVPNVLRYPTAYREEELVSLKERGFIVNSQYYERHLPGSFPDCYVRRSVADRLEAAQTSLPDGIRFKIYDGYRPLRIQKALWDYFIAVVRKAHPDAPEEEIKRRTSSFVSEPSYDIEHPSLHNTGGAVDLSLIDADGDDLDMGTSFDSFKETAWSAYYEQNNSNLTARENRRILYHAMLQAGFTNLPSEWWHFDYGTKFWSYFTGKPAFYRGLLDIQLPGQL